MKVDEVDGWEEKREKERKSPSYRWRSDRERLPVMNGRWMDGGVKEGSAMDNYHVQATLP